LLKPLGSLHKSGFSTLIRSMLYASLHTACAILFGGIIMSKNNISLRCCEEKYKWS